MLIRFCRRRAQALALIATLAPAAATAATITVTTTADGSLPDQCTLRDATVAANTNTAAGGCTAGDVGSDEIVFAADVRGTITLTEGQLTISDKVIVRGPGADALIIDAQGRSRIFDIGGDQETSYETTIEGLTLTGGRTNADGENGGAMRSMSAFHLIDSVVTGNSTAGPNSVGGGLATATTTELLRSRITRNWTEGDGSLAGGVMVVFGTALVVDSTIADNWTLGETAGGGGIVVFWQWFDATFVNSTISGNETRGNASQAGGLAVGGNAFLTNSTVSGNRTLGDNAGGGFIDGGAMSVTGNITLNNSTIVDNSSASAGGVAIAIAANPGTGLIKATNSVIATTAEGGTTLCSKPLDAVSSSHDLATDTSCGSDALVGGVPVAATALALAPLADNGGLTWTHALLPGSAAIDSGDDGACAAAPVDNLDQRGRPRPQDGNGDGTAICDIGAFEATDPDRIFADGFDSAAR
jgi:CSLREA domain-containing protein